MKPRDAETVLTTDRYNVTKEYNNKKHEFAAVFLNHDVYDSLIYSGRINYLDRKIQQTIQNVFSKIKDRNSYVKKIVELEEDVNIGKSAYAEVSLPAGRYCELVVNYDDEIKHDISKLRRTSCLL